MMNWFKTRCNKDNFWNVMFWIGMVGGASFSDLLINRIPILASISFILTLILVPWLLTKWNKVTYNSDKVFINQQQQDLTNRLPKHFGGVLLLIIPFTVISVFCIKDNMRILHDIFAVYVGIVLLIPTLYFIIRNCPISILFNKHAWCEEVVGIKPESNIPPTSSYKSSFSDYSSLDIIYKPRYAGLSCNVFTYHNKQHH